MKRTVNKRQTTVTSNRHLLFAWRSRRLSFRPSKTWLDGGIAIGLWLIAFLWVFWTAGDIGIGYDEPIYGGYALKYLQWLGYLAQCWSQGRFLEPFRPETIDLYWHAKHMHPPIPKLVAALGYVLTHPLVGDDFAAMRSGTAFLFGAMLAAIYWFGREPLMRSGALFAAFAVAFMPRLFADAHFLTMDMPVTATTLIGTLLLLQALEQPNWKHIVVACLGVGMAFSSKANGFLIIPAAIIMAGNWALGIGHQANASLRDTLRRCGLVAVVAMGGMAFLMATWLWLWVDPINRFREYFFFHAKHFGVHTFYLGQLWPTQVMKGQAEVWYYPWHYPLVMTLVTVPAVTLLLALFGAGLTIRNWRLAPPITKMGLVSYFVHIAPFLLPTTPKYNGVRLFEPAFPFVAVLAGYAFGQLALWLLQWLLQRASQWVSEPRLVIAALGILTLAPAAYGTLMSHPFGQSYYNALVGGVRGAKERFEVTYWGVNLLNIIPFLNRQPEGTKVLIVPGALCAYMDFYKNAGMLRKDIIVMGDPKDLPDADFVVFQASQTEWELLAPKMRGLVWELWRKERPAYAANYNDVVIVGVYDRQTVGRTLERVGAQRAAPLPLRR